MNEDTLVVVHCYEGDRDLVHTLMHYYTHHEAPVLLLSPSDSPVVIAHDGVECESAGKKGWKGRHTLRRQAAHWKLALQRPQNWFFLNDADSLCLTPELPEYLYSDPFKIWCNVLCHEGEHLESDRPNLNPPYFMHRSVLQVLSDNARLLEQRPEPPKDDLGFGVEAIDGFYTYLAINELSIPYENFPDGATTWPRGFDSVIEAARRGARMFHGVKNGTQLSFLQYGYNGWLIENALRKQASDPRYEFIHDGPVTVSEEI